VIGDSNHSITQSLNHFRNDRGIALLLVLLILALLVPLILEFDAEARRELREAAAFRDGLKAATLARSGVQAARAILRHDTQLERQSGRQYDAPTDVWGMPVTGYQLGDGVLSATIEDERGKFNLNDFANQPDPKTKQVRVTRLKRLFELIQVEPRLVDAIVDWVDADDIPEPNGAESSSYQTLRPPYRAANGPLQTIAELYLVKGMTDEIVQKLARYVTVYPSTSDGWINLNTADPITIQALDRRITPAMALEILQGRPFRALQETDRVASFEPIAKELRLTGAYQVRSDYFSARISATVNEVTKTARAVLRRSGSSGESAVVYFRIE
jgi:general secretion pathway protein K